MHANQTVEFVKGKHKKWLNFDHMEATIMDALVGLQAPRIPPYTFMPGLVNKVVQSHWSMSVEALICCIESINIRTIMP